MEGCVGSAVSQERLRRIANHSSGVLGVCTIKLLILLYLSRNVFALPDMLFLI